jgi:RNA polymerase sigma factor (sigma-70 family)
MEEEGFDEFAERTPDMANSPMSGVVRHLRRAALPLAGAELTDGQLLERFVTARDEAAFEVLVRRHGPMVLGVCRRVLAASHDAEDAFQATFLVLAHKPAAVLARESVASWLYGVAYRTAQKARATTARRRKKEKEMARPEALPQPGDLWEELRPLIDQELNKLPDKYREPVILCDLEGHTRKEAARRLGCPEGTISGRLARARVLLAKRLARYGLPLSGAVVAQALAENAASAGVPAPLVGSTVKAAALVAAGHVSLGVVSTRVVTLTEGVLKAMFLRKVKLALAVVLGVCLVGAGICYNNAAPADGPPAATGSAPQQPPAEGNQPETMKLPTGPAPVQVLASIDKDGKLVIKTSQFRMIGAPGVMPLPAPGGALPPGAGFPGGEPLPKGPGGPGGKRGAPAIDGPGDRIGGAGMPATMLHAETYNLDDIEVIDAGARKLDKKDVVSRLRRETVALASLFGQPVDPLHLRTIKEGTLIFVLPPPKGIPLAPPRAVPPLPGGGAAGEFSGPGVPAPPPTTTPNAPKKDVP